MGFRFQRRIRIGPGFGVNLSKSGVSTSVGRRGLWFTAGPRGSRTTAGIPGTGVSYSEQGRSRGGLAGAGAFLLALVPARVHVSVVSELELQPHPAMPRLARFFAFAFAAWISSAGAEDVANRPELHVGDVWFFHTTGENRDGKKVDRRWHRQIEEIMPDGTMRVAPRRSTDLFDASWNPIFRDRPDEPPIKFQFPMRVGDAWSYASTGRATADGVPYESRGSMKVVAYESITVPAGTFKCFRIEGEAYWNSAINAQNPDWRYKEQWQITNWYCPDVRYLGRWIYRRYVDVFGRGAYHEIDTQLRRYEAADATTSAQRAPENVTPKQGGGRGNRKRADHPASSASDAESLTDVTQKQTGEDEPTKD